jgi:hypothetical protein
MKMHNYFLLQRHDQRSTREVPQCKVFLGSIVHFDSHNTTAFDTRRAYNAAVMMMQYGIYV